MFGGQFIAKTMMLIFSIPMLSYADINVDVKGLTQMFAGQHQDVDKEAIKIAVSTLSASASLNAGTAPQYVPAAYNTQTDVVKQQQFQQVITNLNTLTEKL